MAAARPDPRATERCLARIDAHDAAIGAMVHLDRDGALHAAAASAARWQAGAPLSPIDGMPIAIKANIAVQRWPWTAGIAAYADRLAPHDAPCVARLRAAGAVLIGLTNMDEGALGAVTENPWSGRTHNPHRHGFTAGGSSGGSAAAVAAGFCVAALGTDTIGSIRIPAAYCGVVGYKPRRGSIPTDGVIALSPTLDHVGVLAARAAICDEATQVMSGDGRSRPARIAGRSIAVPNRGDLPAVDPEIVDTLFTTIRSAAAAGMHIISLPAAALPVARLQRLLLTIAEVEGAIVHHDALRDRPAGFSPDFTALLAWGAGAGAARYAAARQELADVTAAMRAALADVDAVLLPSTPQTAFAFGTIIPSDQAIFATLASCLGDPAAAFPIGLSRTGLPISAQVMAGDGDLCLAIAEALTVTVAQCGSSPPDTFIDSAVM